MTEGNEKCAPYAECILPETRPAAFRVFRRFNDPELRALTGLKFKLGERSLTYFPTDSLPDRLARALAERRAIPIKELFESFEFFARVRRSVRGKQMADLCCGHGLTGLVFAMLEKEVERVTLIDKRRPKTFDLTYGAMIEVAPWVKDKIQFIETDLSQAPQHLARQTALLAVHACGKRTDGALALAAELGSTIAAMPCCYFGTADGAPTALLETFGKELASDIQRTYRLEAAGYQVRWTYIPKEITARNRILICRR